MATIKYNVDQETDEKKIILKENKVSCGCCEATCPEITEYYDVISEEMYNALRAGGNYVANGTMFENNYYNPSGADCNMSASDSGIIPTGNCGAVIVVEQDVCSGENGRAFIGLGYSIFKSNNEYRFTYAAGFLPPFVYSGAWCPYSVSFFAPCYSVGYNIGWQYDNAPPGSIFCPIAGGGITLTTSAGTLGPFGIYTFCGFPSSGSLDITINPFP